VFFQDACPQNEANVCRSFLGQVPIASGCCALLAHGLRTSMPILDEEGEGQPEEYESELKPNVLSFDFPGAITLAIGISSFLIVIDLLNQLSWLHPLVMGTTIVGVVSTLAFLALETYPGNRELLIPLRLLKTEVGAFCIGQVSFVLHCFVCLFYCVFLLRERLSLENTCTNFEVLISYL